MKTLLSRFAARLGIALLRSSGASVSLDGWGHGDPPKSSALLVTEVHAEALRSLLEQAEDMDVTAQSALTGLVEQSIHFKPHEVLIPVDREDVPRLRALAGEVGCGSIKEMMAELAGKVARA